MQIADILDVTALLALRVETRAVHSIDDSARQVRDASDALMKLVEHWRWELAVDRRVDADARRSSSSHSATRNTERAAVIQDDHVRRRANVVTEVLAVELLVRVYTVLLIAQGSTVRDANMRQLVDGLGASINDIGQLARQQFMLLHPDLSWSIKLYRLQKRLDRWSDILLAPMLRAGRLDRFWINKAHVEDWSEHPWQRIADRDVASQLLRRAIQSAVPTEAMVASPRARLVEQLVSVMLMLIPDQDFTAEGVLMSAAQSRAANVSVDSPMPTVRCNR